MRSLAKALLSGDEKAIAIFGHDLSHETLLLRARMMRAAPTKPAVVESLRRYNRSLPPDDSRDRALDRLAAGAVVVCAGQQPGLFSGPIMAFAKAAAAVRLARQLVADEVDAVAVFWIASEDHDFAEANRYFVRTDSEQLESQTFQLPERQSPDSLHNLLVNDDDLQKMREVFGEEEQASQYFPQVGESFGSWYARLFAQLTAGSGLVLLEPVAMASDLKSFRRELLLRSPELTEVMALSTEAIQDEGFATPLEVLGPDSTMMFLATDEGRQKLEFAGQGFRAGQLSIGAHEIDEIIEREPQRLSSAASSRPLAQSALLPVVVQVSGPTESAYMAQLLPLFQSLGLPRPLIYPRPAVTVIDQNIRRLASGAGLSADPESWFQETEAPTSTESPDLETLIQGTKEVLKNVENLKDPFLQRELVSYRRNVMHQLKKISKAWQKAEKKKHREKAQNLHRLEQELRPRQGGQDRVLSMLALGLPLTGEFFNELVESMNYPLPESLSLQIGEPA